MLIDPYVARLRRHDWLTKGPLAEYVQPYIERLSQKRYQLHTMLLYLKCVAHFSYWMQLNGLTDTDASPLVIRHFIGTHLPVCDCPQPRPSKETDSRAALQHLIVLLPQAVHKAKLDDPIGEEIKRFEVFLRDIKGMAPATLLYRRQHIRKFLSECFGNQPVQINLLTPRDIEDRLEHLTSDWAPSSRHVFCTDLRSYFRFRAMFGDDTNVLVESLPVSANWNRRHPPKVLSETELTSFESSFDLTDPVGVRDFAIARLLLDLGLRADEVAHLTLNDVNWPDGVVTVQNNKSHRAQTLPLPASAGQALAHYLKHARPITQSRLVFIRHRAPFGVPLSVAAIRNTMNRAYKRCGLSDRFCSTHVLRRSMATRLQRGGASIKEIADMLRHRDLNTARVYARVDLERLRAVALPWPGRLA